MPANFSNISFSNVSFIYPTRPNEAVLQSFSINVPVNKTVALVGQSGSGKSTVVALMERFYDPTKGEITIDGKPITR